MADFVFDGDDDDDEDYFLVAVEGTLDSNGYAEYVDSFYNYRASHGHYKHARRYTDERQAERVCEKYLERNGVACDIIEITH